MLKNYLRIAQRYLLRYKTYTAINIVGLAVGVTCCILIMLFVRSEFSYDRWNHKAARTYRLWEKVKFPDQEITTAVTELPAGPTIAASFPAVEATSRVYVFNTLVKRGNTSFNEGITVVDSSLFRIFDFRLGQGDREHPFPGMRSVLLTPQLAQKYFGAQNPIGQPLELQLGDSLQLFTVGGIVQPAPEESSVKFGMLISFENEKSLFSPRMLTSWFNVFTETYILLKEGARAADVEKGFPAMMKQQLGKDYSGNVVQHLQPLTAIHLDTQVGGVYQPSNDPKYSYIIASIGVLILLVACINFITLSVGRSTTRAIEVGVRKALGAERRQLIAQFWGEALLLTVVSVGGGFVLALSLLPSFNQLIDRHLVFHPDILTMGFFTVLTIVIAAVAGSYPAFILSGFRPVEVLKGKLSMGNAKGGWLRKGLVVGQFLASIVLLIGTLLIHKQMDFLQSKDLGFNKNQLIIVPTNKGRAAGYALAKLYMGELNKYPQVTASAVSTFSFAESGWASLGFSDQRKQYHTIQYNEVDHRFVEAMQIKMVQGRSFAANSATDTNNSILVNEALVKEYGLKDPVGKRFGVYTQQIVGVMKDFNYESLHTTVKPLVFSLKFDTIARQGTDVSLANETQPRISIRMKGGNLQDNIQLLKKAWAAVAPRQEFQYRFLDQTIEKAYAQEQKSSAMVRIASGLSIFIACMGLFGLATLAVNRRTKELGVRKVLGAGTFRLVRLLSYDFIVLVIIAAVAAVPISAWAIHRWLADFAYRTEMSWWVFAGAGLAAVVIALATISAQTIRAANANPADSLRTE
jgi:putative ABC transport system permease protein